MNINLIFPIATSDRNHAAAQLKALKAFVPYLEDRALILPTPSAMADPMLRPVIDELQSLFPIESCRVSVCQNDLMGGWPAGPNQHFRFAMETLDAMGWDDRDSIWMEADLIPICPNWIKLVKDDYHMASSPFRGMLEKTRLIDTDPVTKKSSPRYTGTVHLVGAGMYPKGYTRYQAPQHLGGSPMASFKNTSGNLPFDVRCEGQHVPATQSPLWLHRSRTVNWRRVNDMVFTCEDQSKDPFGLTYAGPISLAGIALVHGCKDGSLTEAILESVAVDPDLFSRMAEPVNSWTFISPKSLQGDLNLTLNQEKDRSEALLHEIETLKEDLKDRNDDLQAQLEINAQLRKDNDRLSQLNQSPPPSPQVVKASPNKKPVKKAMRKPSAIPA